MFSRMPKPVWVPPYLLFNGYRLLFVLGLKRPRPDVDHKCLTTVRVKNECRYTCVSTSHMCRFGRHLASLPLCIQTLHCIIVCLGIVHRRIDQEWPGAEFWGRNLPDSGTRHLLPNLCTLFSLQYEIKQSTIFLYIAMKIKIYMTIEPKR
jgi:hypothetical protein